MIEKQVMIAIKKRKHLGAKRVMQDAIVARVRTAIEESTLFRGRSHLIRVDERDGRLILEGRLPSYYLKQMLQTMLRDVEGVRQIDNRVAVDWPVEG